MSRKQIRRCRLDEISWVEYSRRLRNENPIVMVPIGSLEQHGPHSPIGSDEMLARFVSEEVARRIEGIVTPSIPYGMRSQPRTGGGGHFPGTTNIRGRTLTFWVRDVVRAIARHGVQRLAIMDSHYENEWFIIEGIDLARRDLHAEGLDDIRIVRVRYFELLPDEVFPVVFPEGFPGWDLEHAGIMTTAMHLYLTPDLVDMSKAPNHGVIQFPPYDVFPPDSSGGTQTGCLNSPAGATAEKGKLIFDSAVAALVEMFNVEFGLNRESVQ